jgi:O-antigen/teichoic acid export membrane protein
VYAIGIAANLLLARLLVPRDFGLVALGTVVVTLGTYLGEAGFGAALVRRHQDPSRAELEAVNGLQLALAGLAAIVCAGAAVPFGRDGAVIALMAASLPIAVLRSPAVIVLERRLQFRLIARADVVAALAYYLWAVAGAALGFGVWALASAVVVRAIGGTAALVVRAPVGLVRPRLSLELVRPLLGFGAKVQTTQLLQIAREQGLSVGVAAVGGIATLGVWNLAWRVIQIPNLLFLTVGRVAFPTMSRLLGSGDDPRPAIERTLAVVAVVTGVVTVALVGFAPGLPALVGDDWQDVPAVLLWSGVALIVTAPVTVASVGYLYAADAAGRVATATAASAVVWSAIALPLVPEHGAPAVGIGWIGGGLVGAAVLWHATASRSGAAVAAHTIGPAAVALVAAGAGWLAAQQAPDTVYGGVLGIAVGEAILLAGLALVSATALREARSLVLRALRPEATS